MTATLKKPRILLLAGNSFRARAYAQTLATIPSIEVCGIFYGFGKRTLTDSDPCRESGDFFRSRGIEPIDFSKSIEETFLENSWSRALLETDDVNAAEVIETIKGQAPDLVVFAGYGGQLIDKATLDSATFIHMHSGSVPEEKGSTTLYYSILNDRPCTVSAIIMVPEIDSGELLLRSSYPWPKFGMNIDRDYDNTIRADTMKQVLRYYLTHGGLPRTEISPQEKENVYYVVHPVLKNIAVLSLSPDSV